MFKVRFLTCILLLIAVNGYPQADVKIAFLADVHLQDLYGNFSDNDYKGIRNPTDGRMVLMRSMDAQLHSTRIFNENYFAFIAALDDIAKRGIKIVALPGDYTDDGQAVHLAGLQRILKDYEKRYGIQFLITTGNHDPVGPFAKDGGKSDFLGSGGKLQGIYSQPLKNNDINALPPVITKDIATLGYEGIVKYMGDFGFLPQQKFSFWATPFSTYDYAAYNFESALAESPISKRVYDVLPGFSIPDASYVVEPVDGLWIMAIDGNSYIPTDINGNPADPNNYRGADLGFKNVLSNKSYLLEWTKKIAVEAKKHNKTLIAFSHYPMLDFNDGASGEMEQLSGKSKWQLNRVPDAEIGRLFANAGITIHFAGHMHLNDTGIMTTPEGNTILNIQTPSLAAYIPAYKLLTLHGKTAEIETITIDEVPGFDTLFPLYEMEYIHLKSVGAADIWNKDILKTMSYREFTNFHLKELVRLRFVPTDWPSDFADLIQNLSGYELLLIANTTPSFDLKLMIDKKTKYKKEWKLAEKKAIRQLKAAGLHTNSFNQWNGMDLITDLYRIRSADLLALSDIGESRIKQYNLIAGTLLNPTAGKSDLMHRNLVLLFAILQKSLNGEPADHFRYDLNTGKLQDISK